MFLEFTKPEYLEDTWGNLFRFKIECMFKNNEEELIPTTIIATADWNNYSIIEEDFILFATEDKMATTTLKDLTAEQQEQLKQDLKKQLKQNMRK